MNKITHIIEQLRFNQLMLKVIHILTLVEKKLMIKIPKLKLVIMQEFQNTKIFLLKDTLQAGLKKFTVPKFTVKNTVPWTYVINDLNGEKIIETFYEKELQKPNQQGFKIGKVIKRNGNKLYVKWKG